MTRSIHDPSAFRSLPDAILAVYVDGQRDAAQEFIDNISPTGDRDSDDGYYYFSCLDDGQEFALAFADYVLRIVARDGTE